MDKEEIIYKWLKDNNYSGFYRMMHAMDEYAKQTAIGFHEYEDVFRREEGRALNRAYKAVGGIFSSVSTPIENVYDDFINKKPIKSYLAPEGIESHWYYNEKGKLVHSSEVKK